VRGGEKEKEGEGDLACGGGSRVRPEAFPAALARRQGDQATRNRPRTNPQRGGKKRGLPVVSPGPVLYLRSRREIARRPEPLKGSRPRCRIRTTEKKERRVGLRRGEKKKNLHQGLCFEKLSNKNRGGKRGGRECLSLSLRKGRRGFGSLNFYYHEKAYLLSAHR